MSEIVTTAEAIKELGVVGLLVVATIVEALVIRQLYNQMINCMQRKTENK